jgi:hypothetical protein
VAVQDDRLHALSGGQLGDAVDRSQLMGSNAVTEVNAKRHEEIIWPKKAPRRSDAEEVLEPPGEGRAVPAASCLKEPGNFKSPFAAANPRLLPPPRATIAPPAAEVQRLREGEHRWRGGLTQRYRLDGLLPADHESGSSSTGGASPAL